MLLIVAGGALAGSLVGSFLNVLIHRLPRGESIVRPQSRCPTCGHRLSAVENVPLLSWLAQRGRCRGCNQRISVRYPIVETLTGVAFALLAWRFAYAPELPAFLYLGAISIALAAIDLDVRRLPNAIVLPSYAVGGLLLGAAALAERDAGSIASAFVGMLALFGGYFLLAVIAPGGMGFGDVKLAGVLGLYLGWLGWTELVVGALAGFLLGGLVGLVLMVTGRVGRKSHLPFGPFMLLGAFLAIFFADPIAGWYLDTMSLQR